MTGTFRKSAEYFAESLTPQKVISTSMESFHSFFELRRVAADVHDLLQGRRIRHRGFVVGPATETWRMTLTAGICSFEPSKLTKIVRKPSVADVDAYFIQPPTNVFETVAG